MKEKIVAYIWVVGTPLHTPIRWDFILCPPNDNHYYGNGHYIAVKRNGALDAMLDVRYVVDFDFVETVTNYCKNYYGENWVRLQIKHIDAQNMVDLHDYRKNYYGESRERIQIMYIDEMVDLLEDIE